MKFSLVSCSMIRFLQVPGTNFSVCVVLNPTEEFTEFLTPRHYTKRAFFHRTDLTTDPPPRCNSFRRAVFKGMAGHYVVQKIHKMGVSSFDQSINSTIHQAVDRTIPGFAWCNSCGTEKMGGQTVPTGGR